MPTVGKSTFAGFESIAVMVTDEGRIMMDRFGHTIKPDEAEKIGLALIKAAALAKEINK